VDGIGGSLDCVVVTRRQPSTNIAKINELFSYSLPETREQETLTARAVGS
jgi:hypothetical protein